MPCAAACSANPFVKASCASEASNSQLPKLSVMMSARLFSTMYSSDRSTPSVLLVVAETTKSTLAPAAIAPDHSDRHACADYRVAVHGIHVVDCGEILWGQRVRNRLSTLRRKGNERF